MPFSLCSGPTHIDKCAGPMSSGNCRSRVKEVAGHRQRIPEALSLDRVIDGKTLSVSHDGETCQDSR